MRSNNHPAFGSRAGIKNRLQKHLRRALWFGVSILLLTPSIGGAIIESNGGITLWVSYESNIFEEVLQHDNGCGAANTARRGYSPGSCALGNRCRGIEKLRGDIYKLAEHVYGATHGKHQIRKVYITDNMHAWSTADIRWHTSDNGSSTSPYDGWQIITEAMKIRNTGRRCIHDEVHHEFGHYLYGLPDRYAASYSGTKGFRGEPLEVMFIRRSDARSVMGTIFPHFFSDADNSVLEVTHDVDSDNPPDPKNETLTPSILEDPGALAVTPHRGDLEIPFALDEWSIISGKHIDLKDIHETGIFSLPSIDLMPQVQMSFYPDGVDLPGTILLMDGSEDIGPAARILQESALHFQHSTRETKFAGSYVISDQPTKFIPYSKKTPTFAAPRLIPPTGKKNIAAALKTAIDDLLNVHSGIVHSAQIILAASDEESYPSELVEQVSSARSKGIRIHTISIGSPAVGVLRQIARSTGGVYLTLPQKADGETLKSDLGRILTKLHGNQTEAVFPSEINQLVRIGPRPETKFDFKSSFDVPLEASGLNFYVFDKSDSSADFSIELQPPGSGNTLIFNADDAAKLGRFVGGRIPNPKRGKWNFRVVANHERTGDVPNNIEIYAYLERSGFQSSVKLQRGDASVTGKGVITASLENPHRLINMEVKASIRGAVNPITLSDDGKTSGDKTPNDGIYTGLFDLDNNSGEIKAEVEFTVTKTSIPSQWVLYEPGTDYNSIVAEYQTSNADTFQAIVGDQFKVFAQVSELLGATGPREPAIESVDNFGNNNLRPGDIGKMSADLSSAVPRIEDVRVSLGQGIEILGVSLATDPTLLRSTILIEYTVSQRALVGTRDVSLQFGPNLLTGKNVFSVTN